MASLAFAADEPGHGDAIFEPQPRQPGKDVMWLPTPDALVTRMLEAAKVTDKDLVVDLGAGDGRIPIAAAKDFGARAIGIEYDRDLAALAKRNAERAGVADKVTIIQGDIFREDFSKATVVTLYLLPDLNFQLRSTLLRMKPGTRIVSHQWDMGEWPADQVLQAGGRTAYLWIVPADVIGRWTLTGVARDGDVRLDLEQQFERVDGTIGVRGRERPISDATIVGTELRFAFVADDGERRSVVATIAGDALSGTMNAEGASVPIAGRRR